MQLRNAILCLGLLMSLSLTGQDTLQLFLPEAIYAVPGIEMNVYFDNILLTINPDRYVFDVDCAKGENLTKQWRFTPQEKDAGEYEWNLSVIDDNGVVTKGQTKLIVISQEAGSNRELSILMIGDSLTNGIGYPPYLHKLCAQTGKPKLKMTGSYHLAGVPVTPDGPANEGYAGWRWSTFLTKWGPLPTRIGKDGKILSNYDYDMALHYARSPFLVEKNGKTELDFQAYLDHCNQGKTPDVITVMLGTNDILATTEDNFTEQISKIFADMDTLLTEFRRVAPQAVIGVGFPPPCSRSQDGFGKMHGCSFHRWQAKQKLHRYMLALSARIKASNPLNISLIPTFINLDCENNYPMRSEALNSHNPTEVTRHIQNVHPAASGYQQIGDTFYCWLKFQLAEQK